MTRRALTISLALSLLAAPAQAHAASAKNMTGGLLVLGGSAAAALAFDYHSQCPSGYTTHTIQGYKTQCVHVDQFGSDVRDQPTSANLARPMMLKAGIGAAALGVIILMVPRKVQQQTPDIAITPTGWRAWKTFSF